MSEPMEKTSETTARLPGKNKHEKLQRAYMHYRAAGEIDDPVVTALSQRIAELESQTTTEASSERAVFPRLASVLWRDIMTDIIVRLAASCAHDGAIREIDVPFALSILDEEIRKCDCSVSRGNGYARQFERLVATMIAVLRRIREAIQGGEREISAINLMIEI